MASPNERIKNESRHLRGTLEESLHDGYTGALREDDTQLSKFHGFYQQDDRDQRSERAKRKLEPLYSFMLRARVPGGVVTPEQWLMVDKLGRELSGGSVRLTTRQTFQYHGILKESLKPLIQGLHSALLDSIAACGDVNRNVLCNTNPVDSSLHQEVYRQTVALSEHLLPNTRAYHEIWLDEEKVADSAEPIYGDTYLPRKFKAAVAVPPHNDVDVYANDLGFVAIAENGKLRGYNVLVGGGMGTTHGDTATYPRVASCLGFISPEQMNVVAEAVLTTQRDHGNRDQRKNARLKYTVDRMGVDAFKAEVEKRSGVTFLPEVPVVFTQQGDRFGWVEGVDGRDHLTLFVPEGRLIDKPGQAWLTGLRAIAQVHQGDFRMTANQNLIIAGVPKAEKAKIEALVAEHGLNVPTTRLRENAMACVALPTCGLAMAEAERYLEDFVAKVQGLLDEVELGDQDIVTRITGCPNGCARPFLAEIGLVGKAPGRYNLFLGADGRGLRVNKLYRENLTETEILAELKPVLSRYRAERNADERFGDFVVRIGVVKEVKDAQVDFHA
ncbi:MAG: assimilatory sulfite reductase (NADPH) hemoprotein subunit [Pseudomonadota bacterium]|uniref:assimilatory sulfite reductase (NADPH) hemoprotein subunit n=1 Tax=Gallaecimonas pentaromativorans TaxID=584787 RepID=UPI00067E9888|nr:assimilatory sulfite reductase (NADPH) hemoprotein subunit [Gallaecimonas pentaromativorans]MED5523333.1 assimilatory sulfite reductase (NADPH) hemoprotein subunit [Pseudomonadota bacterium]